MKAIRIHEFGGPEVLRYEDVPAPELRDGEVLIRVRAVGVNFADHLARIGADDTRDGPIIPGLEATGTVEALGQGVSGLEPGQAVIAWARETYAELAIAPEWAVRPAPGNLSFEQLAAIPIAFGTAWHALVMLADLRPGERVLVHAAGSGVGSAAIQVAKQLGAWVVATAGQDWKLERARDLGADEVINYTDEDVASQVQVLTGGSGADIVLEGVGKATFPASVRSLAEQGRMVIYGSPSGPRAELDTRPAIFRNLTFYGMSIRTSPQFVDTIDAFARRGMPWLEEGKLMPVVDRVYPLSEAAEAHRRLIAREQFGKLVLVI
ncbi:MAG: zinc-binding dehydrogenase [Chloroflexi bacterium]|nr:zinc-binding dehydrogenase [Chloroflexota bacterium]